MYSTTLRALRPHVSSSPCSLPLTTSAARWRNVFAEAEHERKKLVSDVQKLETEKDALDTTLREKQQESIDSSSRMEELQRKARPTRCLILFRGNPTPPYVCAYLIIQMPWSKHRSQW